MNEWDYFLSGLVRALSWRDGQDNALLFGIPSWTYLLGLFVHFQIFLSLYAFLFWGYHKDIKKSGSIKKSMRNKWNTIRESQKSIGRARFVTITGLLLIFFIFPAYEGYRITNGIWRYHYFTNQITELKTALVTGVDTETGGSKSTYSRITFTINVDGKEREVNVSDSNKSLARSAKKHLKPPIDIEVHVNQEGQIVYLK
ncbi:MULTISPECIES: hypothetical protein [Streptococcus]|jgi:hypothetical protein|uniref:hypothetical protein n=1 Tax=Streptococcus TaxID=1301 RepID=UPI0001BB5A6C|nr:MULTISPECIES: hypothetical protein [Streptococcus]EEY80592.1 hypothetical protein HMPREF0847_00973 [Streptococcus sp. 2_1_36FAA]MBZ2123415.1 hypothetical protein [Streptococcus gordonii]WAM21859.1 hypothetical protein OFA61_03965 [Streptococcus gordonii]